jgi:hypothetical protein
MASAAGGGAAGEGEWLKVAQLRAMVEARDPRAKVSCSSIHPPSFNNLLLARVHCSIACYSLSSSLSPSLQC